MTGDAPQIPHLILRPRRGWEFIPFGEIWEFRDLLLSLAFRDVKLRYRQTAIGVVWVVLQPLIGAGLFSFVFGSVAKMSTGDSHVPYFAFSYAGMLCWNLFAGVLQRESDSMVQNANMVGKIYFPRIILPLSTIYGVVLDFAVATVLMAVIIAVYHLAPTGALVLAPLAVLLATCQATGLGLWFAALNVSYRDVRYVVPVLVQFLFWATPVAYSVAGVPRSARIFLQFNPMTGPIELFRHSVLGTPMDGWSSVASSALIALILLVLGALSFQKTARKFADVI